ncbi:MAG: hypothetical protein JWN48_1382 [Myxococcaceae bacterium]|nr:hypothetical protein [Myxococcaceae bacterium]
MTLSLPAAVTAPARPRIVILGAGPAALAAAHKLASEGRAQVTLLEQREEVGGNAGSFQLEGIWCDHGSHRLHAVVEPHVMQDIERLLGSDLLWRPRHGRILLQQRWIHFPLKPLDLLLRLPKRFSASLALDTVRGIFRKKPSNPNFAEALESGLGRTISHDFYFPYVQKLWGIEPEKLAVALARRRVSGSSVPKMLRKILRQLPGLGAKTAAGFYYPRFGFGLISERLKQSAEAHHATIELGAEVVGIERTNASVSAVTYRKNGRTHTIEADAVWSTLPLTILLRLLRPGPPAAVLESSKRIRFRGMILIYLVLQTPQFTEYDAHYFPELSIPISRMSEPKNYSAATEPRDKTILCAELPCDAGEESWQLSDAELGQRMCQWLAAVGLPVEVPVLGVKTRRLQHAYPVYDEGYEAHFEVLDRWLSSFDNLLSYGRQGLFAHDNTHHAMAMAYAASSCLSADGSFDWDRWAVYRKEFESHVVED